MKVRIRQNPERPEQWWVETRHWYQLRWHDAGTYHGYEKAWDVAHAIKYPNTKEVK